MSTGGKYVRAPVLNSGSEEGEPYEEWSSDEEGCEGQETQNSKTADHGECDVDGNAFWSSQESHENQESNVEADGNAGHAKENVDQSAEAGKSTDQSMHDENREYIRKMEQMQNTLDQLVREMGSNQYRGTTSLVPFDDDHSWNSGVDISGPSSTTSSIRWENIQPFPNDVPANRMWEQWNRFIDRFEIAASLSNVNDPVKRSQILFLSMGEKLQGITRAARLRPSLREPNCYSVFVKNIENYLQSMVDITAEHEMFSNLKQGPDEPTITFHARLMEKVRLCRYSPVDQDRFVRMQLLKGMRNKEVAKTARIFGYETTFIVQSATREEAYVSETVRAESPQAFAVVRERQRLTGDRLRRKRRNEAAGSDWTESKKQRQENESRHRGLGRRSRCPKCYRLFHKFGSCPAINRNCDTCGERGHFAVACRKKNANSIKVKRDHAPGWTDDEDNTKVNND